MADVPVGTAKMIGLMDPVKDKQVPCTGVVTIGRDPKDNMLPIEHKSISRHHARVVPEGGAWVVEDLQSTNGVFVNGSRIEKKARLKNGDALNIGEVQFKFSLIMPVNAMPPPPPPSSDNMFEPSIVGGGSNAVSVPQRAAAGDDNLFEPSIVMSGVAPKHSPAPSRPEPNMEGMTITGAGVAGALVKAIKEEREEAQASGHAGGSGGAARRQPGGENMFLLKIKGMLMLLGLLCGIGALVYTLFIAPAKWEPLKADLRALEKGISDFDTVHDGGADTSDNPKELKKELDELGGQIAKSDDITKAFPEMPPEFQKRYASIRDRINFRVFERKLQLAVLDNNKDAANALVDVMAKEGSDSQKELMPLAKVAVQYGVFLHKFPDSPADSEAAPEQKDVDELSDAGMKTLQSEYRGHLDLQTKGKIFEHFAKDVVNHMHKIDPWVTFWSDFEHAKKATGDDKKAKLEQFKKDYPKMKVIP